MFEREVLLKQNRNGMSMYLAYSYKDKIIIATPTPYKWILSCERIVDLNDKNLHFFDLRLKRTTGKGYLCPYEIEAPSNQSLTAELRSSGTVLIAELLDYDNDILKIYEPAGMRVLSTDKSNKVVFSPDSKTIETYGSWIINYSSLFVI